MTWNNKARKKPKLAELKFATHNLSEVHVVINTDFYVYKNFNIQLLYKNYKMCVYINLGKYSIRISL